MYSTNTFTSFLVVEGYDEYPTQLHLILPELPTELFPWENNEIPKTFQEQCTIYATKTASFNPHINEATTLSHINADVTICVVPCPYQYDRIRNVMNPKCNAELSVPIVGGILCRYIERRGDQWFQYCRRLPQLFAITHVPCYWFSCMATCVSERDGEFGLHDVWTEST